MTMFNNKLVVAIKNKGKVLREQGDKVFLPFGSEYSIFIKNLNSVRALVRVELDGQSVTDGEDLVVQGNSDLNLERFLKKGNMESGNRFKFIERTSKVEAHRGVGGEDGILRVEFQFEKVTPKPIVQEVIHHHTYNYPYWYNPTPPPHWYNPYWYGGYGSCAGSSSDVLFGSAVVGSSGGTSCGTLTASNSSVPISTNEFIENSVGNVSTTFTCTQTASAPVAGKGILRSNSNDNQSVQTQALYSQSVNDAGITVAGSVSEQKFQSAAWFPVDDEKFVICLKLLGETSSGQVVKKPVLVRQKQTCPTCGTRNRGQNQFCRECGTALEIVGESPKRRVSVKR